MITSFEINAIKQIIKVLRNLDDSKNIIDEYSYTLELTNEDDFHDIKHDLTKLSEKIKDTISVYFK